MSGLIVLIAVAAWAWIGHALWKRIVRPRVKAGPQRAVALLVLAVIWFVGPVIDEILGAREFERLCTEMPAIIFHGPIPVGPGPFFDEIGRPKWSQKNDILAIKRNSKAWDELFGIRQEVVTISSWPIPIVETRTTDFARDSGKSVVDSFSRSSTGGWLKRVTGWGANAPYQCPSKGVYPNEQQLIVFRAQL